MADLKKLERWEALLLDTGKRNNLISFKDTKSSTAEVLFPNIETVFSRCSVGHVFEVYDPKIIEHEDYDVNEPGSIVETERLNREKYKALYVPRIKNDRYLLTYAQTPNPIKAVKNIAKKAKEMLDETGINVTHFAFGFLKWREKEKSEIYYYKYFLIRLYPFEAFFQCKTERGLA